MVPINKSPVEAIIRDTYLYLSQKLKEIQPDSLDAAFTTWIHPKGQLLVNARMVDNFSVTSYTDVASLAFLLEADPSKYEPYSSFLEDGLQRVSGRTVILPDSAPAPFRYDAVALLGLALGAKRAGGEIQKKTSQWMQSFIAPRTKAIPDWKRLFFYAALGFIGAPLDYRDLQDIEGHSEIKLAFYSRGGVFFSDIDAEDAYKSVCKVNLNEDIEAPLAACAIQAIQELTSALPLISLAKPSVEQLIAVLNNIPAGLRRWPWEEKAKSATSNAQKWDLQNEYHVQSLLYALLAPIFPDLESEFYFEPAGQLNTRADLGIPMLNLIIEVKFLRPIGSFSKIIEEVSADAGLYFQKNSIFLKKYSRMIVFLWDDSGRNQEHHEFKKGVKKIENITDAVVISRPGNMPIQKRIVENRKDKR